MHQSKASFLRLASRTAGSGKSPAFMLGPAGLGLSVFDVLLEIDRTLAWSGLEAAPRTHSGGHVPELEQ